MRMRLGAAVTGALGGLLLAVGGGLTFLDRQEPDWHRTLAAVGYGVALLALCLAGYGIVAHAPVWLRLLVSVAFPLLAASVWQAVDQAIHDAADGWRANATTQLSAGLLLLVVALAMMRTGRRPAYHPSHHR